MNNHAILWDPNVPLPSSDDIEALSDVRLTTVKPYDPYHDGYQFHHGPAIYEYQNALYVSYAGNKRKENTAGETVLVQHSVDRGRSWTDPQIMQPPPPHTGYTHGVFMAREGRLWAFHPQFGDNPFPPPPETYFYNRFRGLRMFAWTLDESTGTWHPEGVVADNFWPYHEPARMDNGNWIIPGMSKDFLSAIAISDGDNFKQWRVIHPPLGGLMGNESTCWLAANRVYQVIRNQAPWNKYITYAILSVSEDYGETWTTAGETNLPMTICKPYCGVLSSGHIYLLGNCVTDHGNRRRYLTIAIGDPGAGIFNRMYLIRDIRRSPSPGGKAEMISLAYPHLIESGSDVYVVHSAGSSPNINNIDLAVVPLQDLIG